jgi:hypothetical protein
MILQKRQMASHALPESTSMVDLIADSSAAHHRPTSSEAGPSSLQLPGGPEAGFSGREHVTPQQRPLSRVVEQQAYVNLSDEEAAALPGVRTGADAVAFYARFGPGSAVKFFHANR